MVGVTILSRHHGLNDHSLGDPPSRSGMVVSTRSVCVAGISAYRSEVKVAAASKKYNVSVQTLCILVEEVMVKWVPVR